MAQNYSAADLDPERLKRQMASKRAATQQGGQQSGQQSARQSGQQNSRQNTQNSQAKYQMSVPTPEKQGEAANQQTVENITNFDQDPVRPTAQMNRYDARQRQSSSGGGHGGQYGGLNRQAMLDKLANTKGPDYVSYETNPNMDWRTAGKVNAQRQRGHDWQQNKIVDMLTRAPEAPQATATAKTRKKNTGTDKKDKKKTSDERRKNALDAVQKLIEGGAKYTPEMGSATMVTEGGKKYSVSSPQDLSDMSATALEDLAGDLMAQGGQGDDSVAYERALDIVKNTPETITNEDGVSIPNPAHQQALRNLREMAAGGGSGGGAGGGTGGQSRADAYVKNDQVVTEDYNADDFKNMQGTGRGNMFNPNPAPPAQGQAQGQGGQPQGKPSADLVMPQVEEMPTWDDTLKEIYGNSSPMPIPSQVNMSAGPQAPPPPPQGRSRGARINAARMDYGGEIGLGNYAKYINANYDATSETLRQKQKKRIQDLSKQKNSQRLR